MLLRLVGGGCGGSKPGDQTFQDLDTPAPAPGDPPEQTFIQDLNPPAPAPPETQKHEDQARPMPSADPTIIAAAAQAAAEARQRDKNDESQTAWKEYNGAKLEAVLRIDEALGDSPVKLVDARFIIEVYKRGGLLCRRQDIPEGAFLTLEEVKQLPKGGNSGDCLRICSASHPWQQPDHPDPKGINLARLAKLLEVLLSHRDGTYAIFFDFLVLHQKPPNGDRTDTEKELFGRSLSTVRSQRPRATFRLPLPAHHRPRYRASLATRR